MGRGIETLQYGAREQDMRRTDKGTMSTMEDRYHRYLGLILGLSLGITAAACVPSEPRSTLRPSPLSTSGGPGLLQTPCAPTATKTMSPTGMPTTAPTPEAPSVRLEELAPGQYVAFEKTDAIENGRHLAGLHLVSIDGVYQGRLAFLGGSADSVLTPDGKGLLLYLDGGLQVMNLLDHALVPIPASEPCYDASWSPGGSALVAQCYDADTNIPDVYILYPDQGTRELLTNWRGPLSFDDFTSPQWSPDGKWIAFLNDAVTSGPIQLPQRGIYLTDTDCLPDLSTCHAATHGPIPCYYGYAWSPDSQLLACANDESIRILGLDGRLVRTLHANDTVSELAWSPDGKWIAASMENPPDERYLSVYIISIDGKELIRLIGEPHRDYFVRFWITIP
jgi:hypothetical protein